MGVEYDLISDATREGYELGKGPWYELPEALRSSDPLDIRTSEARLQAWREAAARKSLELTTWVEATLDREATK